MKEGGDFFMDVKGYDIKCGWLGRMPDGTWRRFPTEDEYKKEFEEALDSGEKD